MRTQVRPLMDAQRATLRDMRDASKEEIKRLREEAREEIKSNREEAEANRKAFQADNRNELKSLKADLTDEQKATLSELGKMFKEDMDALKKELKDAATPEEKVAIYEEMKTLVETHYIAMKDVVKDNAEAVALLEERHQVYLENETLREENRETREEYRTEREETIDNYRENFAKRLGDRLGRISDANLQKLLDRIDTLLAKYENDTTITEARKDKIVGQLVALKELIEEHMENDDVEADVLDIIEEITAE